MYVHSTCRRQWQKTIETARRIWGKRVVLTNSRLYSRKERSRGWSGLAIEDCHCQNGTEEAEPMAAA